MNVEEEKEYIIGLLNNGQYSYAKEKIDELIRVIEKKERVFSKCNTCKSCEFLVDDDCTADEDYRKHNMINPHMSCYDLYIILKSIKNIDIEAKRIGCLSDRLSHMSVEDWFRPFTI